MKKLLVIIIFYSICFLVQAQVLPVFQSKGHFFENSYTQPCRHLKSLIIEDNSYSQWDLTYNRIELELDPEFFFIKGKVYFEFKSLTNNLSSITIDLSNTLNVYSIKKQNENLIYSHSDNKIIVKLNSPLNKGEISSFIVDYDGVPTTNGFDSFAQNFHSDSLASIYTLSEPYGAMEWWPCKQSLIDKIDSIDIVVETPSMYETASNGKLVSNTVNNKLRKCHWKHRHPIATYLVFFSSTVYNIYSNWATLSDGTKIEILNYVYPEDFEKVKTLTPITSDLIELYSNLFIDYPFKDEKYGHAQFGWGGGMEHQTMSSMGGFHSGLIAHELAHQWFGDYITCGSWQDIWLNEGFATYLTGLYYENLDADPWWRVWKESNIAKIISEPGGSIFVQDTTDIWSIFSSRLSYSKGAYVLHMLRGQLGDEPFFNGLKAYLNDERVINNFATTNLFCEIMEEIADTTLSEFFNDWIYGEGYPVYNIDCFYSDQKLKIDIAQSPSTTHGPFFEMKIPISVYLEGKREIIWVANNEPFENIELDWADTPDSVIVDEDLWLLGKFESSYSNNPIIEDNKLKIYFNKFEKSIFVDVPNFEYGEVFIYNLNGQKVLKSEWQPDKKRISTELLKKGIYIIQFSSSKKSIATRFGIY